MSVGGGRERPRGRHYAVKMAICTHPLRSLRKFESTGLPGADHSRPCQALPRLGQAEAVDERIEGVSSEIEVFARQDVGCERLMSVPGVGPIISSAMVAAIGSGDTAKGRDFTAWLALVPTQISTGDRTVMAAIWGRGPKILWDVGRSQDFCSRILATGRFVRGVAGATGLARRDLIWSCLCLRRIEGKRRTCYQDRRRECGCAHNHPLQITV